MPKWLEKKLREGGVDNPYAVMNAAGIMHGSKTVVEDEGEVKRRMSSWARARRFLKRKKGK